jgi:hypothetical protein
MVNLAGAFNGIICRAERLIMRFRISTETGDIETRGQLVTQVLYKRWEENVLAKDKHDISAIIECTMGERTGILSAQDIADCIWKEIDAMIGRIGRIQPERFESAGFATYLENYWRRIRILWDFGYTSWGASWRTKWKLAPDVTVASILDKITIHLSPRMESWERYHVVTQHAVFKKWFAANASGIILQNRAVQVEMNQRKEFLQMSALWPYTTMDEFNKPREDASFRETFRIKNAGNRLTW